MIRHFAALGASTFIRLLTGFLLFVLIAREWGAERFGEFMYLYSVAALLVLACEYGFSQQILRDIGRDQEAVSTQMGNFLAAKVWLTVMSWVLAAIYVVLSEFDRNKALTLALLLLAGTFMSYSDFLMACFRALGRYTNETKVTLWGNLFYFVAGLYALYIGLGALGMALTFAMGRVIHLVVAMLYYRRQVSGPTMIDFRPARAWPVVRGGAAYGLDVGVATAFVNLDTVLITFVLGVESAGIYQAAARFYQGAALLPPIFAGVFLPKMARVTAQPALLSSLTKRLYWSNLLVGIVIAALFIMGAEFSQWIYPDPSFRVVGDLLPWFGLLVLIRFVAAGQGITITALGGQSIRAAMFLGALIIMASSAYPLMLKFGPVGMVMAACLAYAALSLGFWLWSERQRVRSRPALIAAVVATTLTTILVWNLKS